MSVITSASTAGQIGRGPADAAVSELVITDLAAELAEVRADRDSYRELAQQSIHRLAQVTERAVEEIVQLEDAMIRPPEDPDERHIESLRRAMQIRKRLHGQGVI